MDIHPWTKYEIAGLRDEERLLRARSAMLARELRDAARWRPEPNERPARSCWLDRILRRDVIAERTPAGTRA